MIGNFKYIIIITMIAFSCRREENSIKVGKSIISQNINILIDSIERFDVNFINVKQVSTKKEFPNMHVIKNKKLKIYVIDSVTYEKNFAIDSFQKEILKFIINKNDLINFKSNYNINIVKINNYDSNVLFVKFSNFKLTNDKASIEVKMTIGISMIKNIYHFKKVNNIWLFDRKEFLEMG